MRRDDLEDLDKRNFDKRNVARDGARLRVPVLLMDGKPQGVAITDTSGSLRGLHRPGWRVQSGGNRGDELVREGARLDRAEIYRLYDAEQENAWRNPPIGAGSHGIRGAVGPNPPYGAYPYRPELVGTACSVDGRRGRLVEENGWLVCSPIGSADVAAVRKKQLRDPFGRESGSEESEPDGVCDTCDGSGQIACPHCGGIGIARGARQTGWVVEKRNGDNESEGMLESMTTRHESSPPQHFDSVTLDALRVQHAANMRGVYADADRELTEAWRTALLR